MSDRTPYEIRMEAVNAYGDVPLLFSSYYKYSFTFTGVAPDGAVISASIGGNSEEIYRKEVWRDVSVTMKDIFPYCGEITKDGVKIFDWYDY